MPAYFEVSSSRPFGTGRRWCAPCSSPPCTMSLEISPTVLCRRVKIEHGRYVVGFCEQTGGVSGEVLGEGSIAEAGEHAIWKTIVHDVRWPSKRHGGCGSVVRRRMNRDRYYSPRWTATCSPQSHMFYSLEVTTHVEMK